jgi:hypothetical protein
MQSAHLQVYIRRCIKNLIGQMARNYLFTYLQSTFRDSNLFSASQEIPRILWNPNVHYCIQNCRRPVPIMSRIDPVHDPNSTSWRSMLVLFSLLRLDFQVVFSLRFPQALHTPLKKMTQIFKKTLDKNKCHVPRKYFLVSLQVLHILSACL